MMSLDLSYSAQLIDQWITSYFYFSVSVATWRKKENLQNFDKEGKTETSCFIHQSGVDVRGEKNTSLYCRSENKLNCCQL